MGWNDLLHELLSIIFHNLITHKQNVPDLYQCLGVCSSWRHLAKECLTTLAPPAPWLLLGQKIRNQTITFTTITCKINPNNYNPNDRKTALSFNLINHTKVYASYDGWLLVGYDDKDFRISTAFLYNPLSGFLLQLPPFPLHIRLDKCSKIKFVMSKSCPRDPNCVICVKFTIGASIVVAFCKPAPSNDDHNSRTNKAAAAMMCLFSSSSAYWDVLEKHSSEIEDIIFYCGKFYSTDRYDALSVYNYDANTNAVTSESVILDWFDVFNNDLKNVATRGVRGRSYNENYNSLVKSKSGDLLMIKRIFNKDYSRVTESCSIYKLNRSNIGYYPYWSGVSNLEEKEAIFLGWHDCISVSISDYNSTFKPNHIYFFDKYSSDGEVLRYGVYDLMTSKFRYYSDDNGVDRDPETYQCCRLFAPSALS